LSLESLAALILSKNQSQLLKLNLSMARIGYEPSDIFDERDFINHGAVSPLGDSKRHAISAL